MLYVCSLTIYIQLCFLVSLRALDWFYTRLFYLLSSVYIMFKYGLKSPFKSVCVVIDKDTTMTSNSRQYTLCKDARTIKIPTSSKKTMLHRIILVMIKTNKNITLMHSYKPLAHTSHNYVSL